MKVESIAEYSKGKIQGEHSAVLSTFFKQEFSFFLRVAVFHRFNCTQQDKCEGNLV